jgi:4-hydroxybenzoate polyprenyltransferase
MLLRLPEQNAAPLLIFVFCTTFFIYNIQRIIRLDYQKLIGKYIGIRLSWIIRNRKIITLFSLLSAIVAIIFALLYLSKIIFFSIPLGIISVLYVIPFYKKKALRHFTWSKISIIAFVWASTTILLPVILNLGWSAISSSHIYLLFIEQFLFIFAITLPFDVRDLKYDLSFKMRTIPSKIGITKTIQLAHLFLLITVGLKYYQLYSGQINSAQFIANSVAIFITGVIIAFTSMRRSELFFSGLVESTMILLYLSTLVLQY